MVSMFENNDSAWKAVAYMGQFSGAHSLHTNQSIYTLVRGFISTEMTIANAHRSGVLANMTIGELEEAKETKQLYSHIWKFTSVKYAVKFQIQGTSTLMTGQYLFFCHGTEQNLNLGNFLLLSMLLGRRQGWKGMFLPQYFGSQPSQRFMEITKKWKVI